MWNIICIILIKTSADTETETSVASGNIGLGSSESWPVLPGWAINSQIGLVSFAVGGKKW